MLLMNRGLFLFLIVVLHSLPVFAQYGGVDTEMMPVEMLLRFNNFKSLTIKTTPDVRTDKYTFAPKTRVVSFIRYTDRQAGQKTVWRYNSDNELISKNISLNHAKKGEGFSVAEENVYEYENRKLKSVRTLYLGGLNHEANYTYNDKGKPTGEMHIYYSIYDTENQIIREQITVHSYRYSGDSVIIDTQIDGKPYSSTLRTKDQSERVVRDLYSDAKGKLMETRVYYYNHKGQLTRDDYTPHFEDFPSLCKTLYIYNVSGLLTEIQTYKDSKHTFTQTFVYH